MNNPYNNPYIPRSKPRKKSCTNLASCIAATVFLLLAISTITILYFLIFKPTPPKITVDAVQFPTFSTDNSTVSFTYFQYVTVSNPNRDMFTHFDSSLELVSEGQNVGVVFIPAGKIYGGRVQHMAAKFVVEAYPIPPSGASRVAVVVAGGPGGSVLGGGDGIGSGHGDVLVDGDVLGGGGGNSGENASVGNGGGDGGNGGVLGDGGNGVGGGNVSGGQNGGGGKRVGPSMQIETRMNLVGRVKVLKVFTHKVESRIKCGVAVEIVHGTVLGFHC